MAALAKEKKFCSIVNRRGEKTCLVTSKMNWQEPALALPLTYQEEAIFGHLINVYSTLFSFNCAEHIWTG